MLKYTIDGMYARKHHLRNFRYIPSSEYFGPKMGSVVRTVAYEFTCQLSQNISKLSIVGRVLLEEISIEKIGPPVSFKVGFYVR